MIKLQKALDVFSDLKFQYTTQKKKLSDSNGFVLAEDVFSDVNMPPFNKSAMDGYACRKKDLDKKLEVLEFIGAGELPKYTISEGTCSKIMTGAKVPEGADCVIMVEHTEIIKDDLVRFTGTSTKENICFLGEDIKTGQKVASQGSLITPAVIAMAASVGKSVLSVHTPPKISLIATGDELVEPDIVPEGPFIRNSNAYNLQAQISQTPAIVDYKGIVGDSKNKLMDEITAALENSDILILTGGVSMGDKDFVPEILKTKGLDLKFNKLAIQPGRPIAFAYGEGKFCFALSGNPVSSLLQFEILVRPFIYKFMGNNYQLPIIKIKTSTIKNRKKTERMQFFPLRIENGEVRYIEFHGSAHIAGMVDANAFGIFPVGVSELKSGEEIEVLLLNSKL